MPKPSVLVICKICFHIECFTDLHLHLLIIDLVMLSFCRKQCILAENRFDFLKDLVLTIPDVQGDGEDGGGSLAPGTPNTTAVHPPLFRSQSSVEDGGARHTASSSTRGAAAVRRPRGRPRKIPQTIQR